MAEAETSSANPYEIQLDKPLENQPDYPIEDYTSLMVNVLDGAVQAEVCVDEEPLKRTEPLSAEEQQALQRCETVVQRHKQSFYEFALALEEIKRRKLYRDRFKTFPAYCLEVHGLGKSYAYQHAAAGKLLREKSTTVENAPANEHQARQLVAKAAKPRKAVAAASESERPLVAAQEATQADVEAVEARPPIVPMPVFEGGTSWVELHALAEKAYNILADSSRRSELEKALHRLKTALSAYAEQERRSTALKEAA
jgi:hypothetical protein